MITDNIKEMRLQAKGIVCISCAEDMEKILRDKNGIIDVSVSYADDSVVIKYNPETIDRKEVYASVRKLTFPLKIISES